MKKFALLFVLSSFTLLTCQSLRAQSLDFMGYPMGGNIADFTAQVRQRYPLQKKVGGDQYYIFKGSIYGHDTYFKAEYSRKSKTVYKITVTPKSVDQNALADSLIAHFGDPLEVKNGYRWNQQGGTVFLYLPEGYDPVLIYIDEAGVAKFREEK